MSDFTVLERDLGQLEPRVNLYLVEAASEAEAETVFAPRPNTTFTAYPRWFPPAPGITSNSEFTEWS